MPTEWGALLRTVGPSLLRWLPGRVLRWWYPAGECSAKLTVSAPGVGPHIYVNAERSPAIASWDLALLNGLPFPVKVERFHLDFSLESRALTNAEQTVQETVPAGQARQVSVREIHLSDGQARIVRQYVGEGPVLRITGHVSCTSAVGEFTKNLQTQTRAFIYRGGGSR